MSERDSGASFERFRLRFEKMVGRPRQVERIGLGRRFIFNIFSAGFVVWNESPASA